MYIYKCIYIRHKTKIEFRLVTPEAKLKMHIINYDIIVYIDDQFHPSHLANSTRCLISYLKYWAAHLHEGIHIPSARGQTHLIADTTSIYLSHALNNPISPCQLLNKADVWHFFFLLSGKYLTNKTKI
jgi:hypothetical protein